jgi:hypothetical protein
MCNVWNSRATRYSALKTRAEISGAPSARALCCMLNQTLHVWLPSPRRFAANEGCFKQLLKIQALFVSVAKILLGVLMRIWLYLCPVTPYQLLSSGA